MGLLKEVDVYLILLITGFRPTRGWDYHAQDRPQEAYITSYFQKVGLHVAYSHIKAMETR